MQSVAESQVIDRVVYTASLATRAEDIDPILDVLRGITSRPGLSRALSPDDLNRLNDAQARLETYLVTKERLRYFTAESLQIQIEQHMRGDSERKVRPQLRLVIVVSCLFAIAAASLPLLSGAPQRGRVAGGVLFSAITIGAAWLFLKALPAFTSQLRHPFRMICAGVTLLGLSLLEQPILHVLDIQDEPLVNLLYPIPILAAAVLFHTGNALYVRLVGIRNFWSSAKPLILAGVVLSVISWFLPHPMVRQSEIIHDLAAVIWVWVMITPIASAIILPMAVRRLPEVYKPSIRALSQAMFPIIGVTSYLYILSMFSSAYVDSPLIYALFLMVIVMSIFLLRAGYMFNKVSKY